MGTTQGSYTHIGSGPKESALTQPRALLGVLAAIALSVLFLSAGIYKATDPYKFANLAKNLLVPIDFTLPLAVALAIAETTAGVLLLIPRFRRWGAMLAGFLLLSFMIYIGWNYRALIGRDCSCFPELRLPFGIVIDMRRSVGPGFFYGDGAMVALAALAGYWARPSSALKKALLVPLGVIVFVGISFAVAQASLTGLKAPDSIVVDGKPMSLQSGRIALFFYDPNCGTCNAVARSMGPLKWRSDVTLIGLPTNDPQFAEGFLKDNKLNAKTSLESNRLRQIFKFDNPPFLALIERGRETGSIQPSQFDEDNPAKHIALLKQLGLVE